MVKNFDWLQVYDLVRENLALPHAFFGRWQISRSVCMAMS